MTRTPTRRATRAWILLVLLTILSMITGHAGAGGLIGSGVVLTAAVAKGWFSDGLPQAP